MNNYYLFEGPVPFRYFITSPFDPNDDTDAMEVTEKEFFQLFGFNRGIIPMRYDEKNINRQNFYLDDVVVAFRIRGALGFKCRRSLKRKEGGNS